MADGRWSNEETFTFIELYQQEPSIWNPRHKQHKDENAVHDAWKKIADAMGIPVGELKKKKESLMAAFRLNHKKVLQTMRSGAGVEDTYKSAWIFYDALATFIADVYDCKSILTTEDEVDNEPTIEDNAKVSEEGTQSPLQIRGQKRRCKNPLELQETQAQVNTALNALNNVLSKNQNQDDDCDLYAKRLRALPETERQQVMYEFDGILLNRRKRLDLQRQNRFLSVASPSQGLHSRPSSSRTIYTYSIPSDPPTSPVQSIDSINSAPSVLLREAPSPYTYVSPFQKSPQQPIIKPKSAFRTVSQQRYSQGQSQDIISLALRDTVLEEDYE